MGGAGRTQPQTPAWAAAPTPLLEERSPRPQADRADRGDWLRSLGEVGDVLRLWRAGLIADLGDACPPYLLETSVPGIFAVGDVRSGGVKRVACAVGEGAMGIQLIHKVLAE